MVRSGNNGQFPLILPPALKINTSCLSSQVNLKFYEHGLFVNLSKSTTISRAVFYSFLISNQYFLELFKIRPSQDKISKNGMLNIVITFIYKASDSEGGSDVFAAL